MKKYIIAAGILGVAMSATAQSEYDALRFSQTYQQGTARSAAMGGAFGALGGDISVTAINPAGMSIYRGADVCLTPMVLNNTVKSTINGREDEDSKFTMKFASIGIVMGNDRGKTTGFTNFAWGVTYNRLNDFSANERLGAFNQSSSMLDRWQDMANQDVWSDYTNGLAYDSGLMFDSTVNGTTRYFTPHDKEWGYDGAQGGYGEYQSRTVTQKGGIGTWDFAISGAYNDMFFFGASLGVQSVNYKFTSRYHEDDKSNLLPYEHWDFNEKLKINGGGVNLKLGLIVKPVQFIRIGAAFHTPTVYNLTDKYYTTVYNLLDNGSSGEKLSQNNSYEYDLVTPMKGILSAAFIVPGYGLVSFDYESVNYGKAKFQNEDFDDDDFSDQNDAIKAKFKKTNNFRVGLEGLAGPVSIRAGYAMYGNPYKFVSGNKQRQILSFGLGFKATEDIYLDLTGTYHIYQTDAVLYEWADKMQTYNYDNRYLNVMLTFGVKL